MDDEYVNEVGTKSSKKPRLKSWQVEHDPYDYDRQRPLHIEFPALNIKNRRLASQRFKKALTISWVRQLLEANARKYATRLPHIHDLDDCRQMALISALSTCDRYDPSDRALRALFESDFINTFHRKIQPKFFRPYRSSSRSGYIQLSEIDIKSDMSAEECRLSDKGVHKLGSRSGYGRSTAADEDECPECVAYTKSRKLCGECGKQKGRSSPNCPSCLIWRKTGWRKSIGNKKYEGPKQLSDHGDYISSEADPRASLYSSRIGVINPETLYGDMEVVRKFEAELRRLSDPVLIHFYLVLANENARDSATALQWKWSHSKNRYVPVPDTITARYLQVSEIELGTYRARLLDVYNSVSGKSRSTTEIWNEEPVYQGDNVGIESFNQ